MWTENSKTDQNPMGSFGEEICGWTDRRRLWCDAPRLLMKQHRWKEIIDYHAKEIYFEVVKGSESKTDID
jgi:hypothetical protein